MHKLALRIKGKYRRTLANRLWRHMASIETSDPIISFTFDDAPRTAFITGGDILKSHGALATFFVSLGLLGSQTEGGVIAYPEDLLMSVRVGNELGCHTYDHRDTWQTPNDLFIESIEKNQKALNRILPGLEFKTFAYPISEPRPFVKSLLEKYFSCCRGGGQIPNIGRTDLNLLKACFLDKRAGIGMSQVKELINHNISSRGWLIFATHDVSDNPSPYGCTPKFFEEVVKYSVHSGAIILPVMKAYEKLWSFGSNPNAST
jgi:peptidoglycan/xylan/chitin deacetylase (PgdA/CDA1 family)